MKNLRVRVTWWVRTKSWDQCCTCSFECVNRENSVGRMRSRQWQVTQPNFLNRLIKYHKRQESSKLFRDLWSGCGDWLQKVKVWTKLTVADRQVTQRSIGQLWSFSVLIFKNSHFTCQMLTVCDLPAGVRVSFAHACFGRRPPHGTEK